MPCNLRPSDTGQRNTGEIKEWKMKKYLPEQKREEKNAFIRAEFTLSEKGLIRKGKWADRLNGFVVLLRQEISTVGHYFIFLERLHCDSWRN